MCIREVRIYRCPGPPGTGHVAIHLHKYNNICSALWTCPEECWQRREKYLNYPCPSCTGESESANTDRTGRGMTSEAISDQEAAEPAVVMAAVDNYLGSWAKFLNMMLEARLRPIRDATAQDQAGLYLALAREDMCKEHSHMSQRCNCDAQASSDRLFLYNPASGVRNAFSYDLRRTVQATFDCPPEVAEDVLTRLEALDRDRMANQGYFREGRGRQVPKRLLEVTEAKTMATRLIQQAMEEALATMPEREFVPQADYLNMVQARWPVIMCLVSYIVDDVGLTNERLNLVIRRLVRASYALEPCDYHLGTLMRKLSFVDMHHPIWRHVHDLSDNSFLWLLSHKREWNEKHHLYEIFEAVFLEKTREVTKKLYDELTAQDRLECGLCYETFFDAPDQRDEPPSPATRAAAAAAAERDRQGLQAPEPAPMGVVPGEGDLMRHPGRQWDFFAETHRFSTGEIPVRVKGCGHVFGQRCLFRHWTEAVHQGVAWRCPMCRKEVYVCAPEAFDVGNIPGLVLEGDW